VVRCAGGLRRGRAAQAAEGDGRCHHSVWWQCLPGAAPPRPLPSSLTVAAARRRVAQAAAGVRALMEAWCDRTIDAAFENVLGRTADPDGRNTYYTKLLSKGADYECASARPPPRAAPR